MNALGGPGAIRDDTSLLKEALGGNNNFAVRQTVVSPDVFYKAVGIMKSFNGLNYSIDTQNCAAAAMMALSNSGAIPGMFYMPGLSPTDIYNVMKAGK